MTLIDFEIKDTPDDCIEQIKRAAAIVIDRYYRKMDEKVDPAVIAASNVKKDAFRVANGLDKQY